MMATLPITGDDRFDGWQGVCQVSPLRLLLSLCKIKYIWELRLGSVTSWEHRMQVRSPAQPSGLRIHHCHSCGLGHNCHLNLIPGQGAPYAMGRPKKKKKGSWTQSQCVCVCVCVCVCGVSSHSQAPAGCLRIQLNSDTLYPEKESDSTGRGLRPTGDPPLQMLITSPGRYYPCDGLTINPKCPQPPPQV